MPRRVCLRTYSKVQGPDGGNQRSTLRRAWCSPWARQRFRRRMPLAVVAGQSRRAQVNEAGEEVAPPLVCAAVDFGHLPQWR
eukprot:scaffold36795_cov63-Phaeocystis_antarctica.AAC.4